MGLFSFFKGQFIEVIEWLEDTDSMVYRFPTYDNAIKEGAKLIVRETQAAIFVNEGKLADVFGPGTYTLTTANIPIITAMKSWKHGFETPFKADVYFVNMATYTNLKWGTTNPLILRDAEFGVVRARGFGTYSIRVRDPQVFLEELIGTKSDFTTAQITGFLKSIIVNGISDLLGESKIPIVDLAASYEDLSLAAAKRIQHRFEAMGLTLMLLLIENISLPDEVEKMIDRRSSMNIAGNVDQYMKFQTAEAIRESAGHPGGMVGAGAELSAGMAMGQMMSQMLNQRPAENNPASPPASSAGSGGGGGSGGAAAAGGGGAGAAVACAQCGHSLLPAQKFCPECGAPRPQKKFCAECGEPLADGAKFCSTCGTKA